MTFSCELVFHICECMELLLQICDGCIAHVVLYVYADYLVGHISDPGIIETLCVRLIGRRDH
jgi:hypothetical protein